MNFQVCQGLDKGNAYLPFYCNFLNDLEEEFIVNGIGGIDIGLLKLFYLIICRCYRYFFFKFF